MRTTTRPARSEAMQPELSIAIGLIWGHLNTRQYEEAHRLARGCLRVWPDEQRLVLMDAYAKVELGQQLDDVTLSVLKSASCTAWTSLVLRRAGLDSEADKLTAAQ